MAWIHTVDVEKAEGRIGSLYKAAIERAGRVYGIVRLMSIEPHILEASMSLYMSTTTTPRSSLPRWFRELIAVTVSRLNDCFY